MEHRASLEQYQGEDSTLAAQTFWDAAVAMQGGKEAVAAASLGRARRVRVAGQVESAFVGKTAALPHRAAEIALAAISDGWMSPALVLLLGAEPQAAVLSASVAAETRVVATPSLGAN